MLPSPKTLEQAPNLATSSAWAKRWTDNFDDAQPEEILRWVKVRFSQRAAIVTSFQAEGMVILDLVHKLGLGLRVITIDTGRLPDETYQQIERVRNHYGFEVEVVMPDPAEVSALVSKHGPDLFKTSSEMRLRCCFARKVRPFAQAVRGLDCWIAGLRNGQGNSRSAAARIELDLVNRPVGTLFKVNPLINWTEERVWQYIHDNNVPYHPLYDRGYRSVGCAPCTRPSLPGESARDSRWWWENGARECGLHQRFDTGNQNTGSDSLKTLQLKPAKAAFSISLNVVGEST